MILVFTHKVSNSLLYVLDHIFSKTWGVNYEITQDENLYHSSQAQIKIHYTSVDFIGHEGNWVPNSNFLFTENYKSINIQDDLAIGTVKFFKNKDIDEHFQIICNILSIGNQPISHKNDSFSLRKVYFPIESKIGFDVFAHIFALISNVEETILGCKKHQTDEHGRLETSQLNFVKEGMHLLPMADIAILQLQEFLAIKPTIDQSFEIIPTADIDQCFQFKGKSAKRFWGGFLAHPKTSLERLKFLFTKKDNFTPSQTVQSMLAENPNSRIFWLCNEKTSDKNKQIPRENLAFKKEILQSQEYARVGIHPSFQIENQLSIFGEEKAWLETIIGDKIEHSRQHYLHFELPKTYQILEKLDIQNDWSMGFSNTIGFRNGSTKPVQWFNIFENRKTNLTVHSFSMMDVTCKNYLKLNSFSAIQINHSYKQILESMNGNFCFIIHNESMSETEGWKGWGKTFKSWASTT